MIKILNLASKRSSPFTKNIFRFSTASDPYYILGVEKAADFKEIKKCFFKLANEYHPDKNDSADAKKNFLLVKQAFEQIKIQKGLMKPQNFVDSVQHDSFRPNADQFTPDQEEGYKSTRDYRIFRQKAGMNEKYSQFNSSFQTIHDINDIKIKVQQGQMKDASSRFNLQSMRAKIVVRSQSSLTVVVIGMAGLFLILAFINQASAGAQENIQKQIIISNSQLNKQRMINSQKDIKQQSKADRQKKINHEQLMKIIHQDQYKKNDSKQSATQSAFQKRNAWSKLVQDQKEQFIYSRQKVV